MFGINQSRALLLAHSTTIYIHLNDDYDYDADDAELNNLDKPPSLRLVHYVETETNLKMIVLKRKPIWKVTTLHDGRLPRNSQT